MENDGAYDSACAGSRIRILPPEEARKIAAGEVIDRPAALVREFLDNAIDAGASEIEVNIEGGGALKAEVIDNGEGMGREDLLLCPLTHATSKIRSLDDLAVSHTLGFRGEALAAAAAVSRLEILSSRDGREAWLLAAGPGAAPAVEQSRRTRGTTVRALGLFDTIPARKRFLKREGSEGTLCRQAFVDKALAFPERTFRFTQDGVLKDFFPPVPSHKERFAQILLKNGEGAFLHEIAAGGPGFDLIILTGGPELGRGDRRRQYVFANRRRIDSYGLLQALEYGVQGWFPNGTHPTGALYIDVDPRLADFNIHPAKREVRFADAPAIHHAITTNLRTLVRHSIRLDERGGADASYPSGTALFPDASYPDAATACPAGRLFSHGPYPAEGPGAALAMEALLKNPPAFAPLPGRGTDAYASDEYAAEESPPYTAAAQAEGTGRKPLRLIGRAFGLFILVEAGEKLFIIDQHAAHERIIYDRFLANPVPKQDLLVPIPFETESADDDRFLEDKKEELSRLGVIIEKGDGCWHIETLPADWRLGDRETVGEILALKTAAGNLAERWAATLSCHGAVRDGDYLDDASALDLAGQALRLPVPRCPHGRPVWTELTRASLLKAVKRL
jgi:DNA mismatch repair protein MutL